MFKKILTVSWLLYWSLEAFTATAEPSNLLPPPPKTQNQSKTGVKEYIYRAPTRTQAPIRTQATVTRKKSLFYRVEVPGDCSSILNKVKKVEPSAFIKHRDFFIQAGLFKQLSQAQQCVQKLARIGLLARIVKVYR